MPKQGKTPKKKSKEKTPQKSGESEYPEMDQDEFNRFVQNAIEQSQAQLQQKHEEQIKRLDGSSRGKRERLGRSQTLWAFSLGFTSSSGSPAASSMYSAFRPSS